MNGGEKTRTIHQFPNLISIARQPCPGGFFKPDPNDIEANLERLKHYFNSPTVGVILPLASAREQHTFPQTLHYVIDCGVDPERIVIVYSPRAQGVIDHLKNTVNDCTLIDESIAEDLLDTKKIDATFGVDLARLRGKGRALAIAFIFLKYVSPREQLQDLFLLDVDSNITEYRPLHYLGYPQVAHPDPRRLFLLTAQNNALRDNAYLFIMRDSWRYENALGDLYARHFDQLVWSLTGEMMLRWQLASEIIPFGVSYGQEITWQAFAAEQTELAHEPCKVSQVVNPQTKIDGGGMGQSGRCYDAMMYRQSNLMLWFLIKQGKPLSHFTAADYRTLNNRLRQVDAMSILPDNEDHGPPYRVDIEADLFIPPIAMLAAEGCLRV